VFQSERDNLELAQYEWDLDNVEKRLLGLAEATATPTKSTPVLPKKTLEPRKKR
jgi:hypothetical protein